ncbi:MAG TPA: DNA glycosylase [Lacunisphaera sp.]|nr:DNA glycosylase [Lacunisphaera sp.]
MKPGPWSDWQAFAPGIELPPAVLAEILDGGQAFRWFRSLEPSTLRSRGEGGRPHANDDVWTGTWSEHVAQLRRHEGRLEWRAPAHRVEATAPALARLLATDTDWPALTDSLPWRSDPHLATCITAFPGLRLLRQPFGETLLCFLCSATKQIVQIKQMVALLAQRHGNNVCRAGSLTPPHGGISDAALQFRLPTWAELATIPEKDLRGCLLGFRARFIHETALFLAARPGWLDETEGLPYPAAKARMLELPGVGEKVADCVLLFGAGRLEAFPVDTWVLKSLARRYGLDGWRPAQVAHFGRTHFGPLAGLAQQYLFAWERRHGRGQV